MTSRTPTATPAISVVIPHYGDPTLALALVDDLRKQLTPDRDQVIVVDDCSPEPFPEHRASWCSEGARTEASGLRSTRQQPSQQETGYSSPTAT